MHIRALFDEYCCVPKRYHLSYRSSSPQHHTAIINVSGVRSVCQRGSFCPARSGLQTSVASAIVFDLCSSCCKAGYFFDQHDAWNDVVRGITQAIEPCASKLLKTSSIYSIKWIAEGVCNVVTESISMAALPSPHRFAHASGGLYLGIRFLSCFKHQGQELLVDTVLKRPDDSFFTGLIAIIDEAALTAPRVAACYN
jgi:hypothetical protein